MGFNSGFKGLKYVKLEAEWPFDKYGACVASRLQSAKFHVAYRPFYKHCDPRFQWFLIAGNEMFLRKLVESSPPVCMLHFPSRMWPQIYMAILYIETRHRAFGFFCYSLWRTPTRIWRSCGNFVKKMVPDNTAKLLVIVKARTLRHV